MEVVLEEVLELVPEVDLKTVLMVDLESLLEVVQEWVLEVVPEMGPRKILGHTLPPEVVLEVVLELEPEVDLEVVPLADSGSVLQVVQELVLEVVAWNIVSLMPRPEGG